MKFLKDRHLCLIPAFLVIVCFINTLGNGFVYDDIYHIVTAAPVLGDWSSENLKIAVTTDSWTFLLRKLIPPEELKKSVYYRPALSLYWMLTYAYAGTVEWRWHLTSILLHAITAALVYHTLLLSLRKLHCQDSHFLALLAATVFAVHPAQSESVAWVAAAANSLTTIPILLSLMAYLKARDGSAGWLLGSAALYALALFTKEFAVILPLLLLAYELFILDKLPSLKAWLLKSALYSLPFILITLSFFLIRYRVLGVFTIGKGPLNVNFPEIDIISRAVQLYTLPTIVLTYLKNILLPFSLKPFYPVSHIHSPTLFNFYLPAAAALLLLVFCVAVAWRYAPMRLGLIWFLVPFLPALEIRSFKVEHLVLDRYLYLALTGAGLILSCAVVLLNGRIAQPQKEGSLRGSVTLTLLLVLGLLMATTIQQNQIWADEWSYWGAAQQGHPQGCITNIEMGRLSYKAQLYAQAVDYYERARNACPLATSFSFQLGTLYIDRGMLDQAEREFTLLLKQPPNSATLAAACYNLALISQRRGDKAQAVSFYNRAIEADPSSDIARQARITLLKMQE